jgi:hypothetical protein
VSWDGCEKDGARQKEHRVESIDSCEEWVSKSYRDAQLGRGAQVGDTAGPCRPGHVLREHSE